MVNSFESLRSRLERRQRIIRGLTVAGWALLVALGLTALLVILGSVRLLPPIALRDWVSVNVLIGALAFGVGWLSPFNRTEMFFRADRNLRSQEQLVTLYELSCGDGPQEFLPLLERRLERLALDVREALPMAQQDRWRWMGVLALALFCLGMTSFVPGGIWVWPGSDESAAPKPADSPSGPLPERELAEWLQAPPGDLAQKLGSWRERLERARAAFALNPNDPRARAALQELQAEISQEQGRLLPGGEGPSTAQSEKSSSDASLTESPEAPARPHSGSPERSSQLEQLLQGLRSIQGQAQNLSPEELQELLDQLSKSDSSLESLVGQILQSVRSSTELSEKLEEFIKNLEERQRFSEELENLQSEVQSALSQSEQSEAPTARSNEGASGSDQPQDMSQSSQNALGGAESRLGERREDDESRSLAGYGHAPLDPEAIQDLPDLSQVRERTRPLSVPGPQDEDLEILFEIISMGLPQNADAPAPPNPVLQIDYGRVDALIDTLEIPLELRESVRRYFLSLSRR